MALKTRKGRSQVPALPVTKKKQASKIKRVSFNPVVNTVTTDTIDEIVQIQDLPLVQELSDMAGEIKTTSSNLAEPTITVTFSDTGKIVKKVQPNQLSSPSIEPNQDNVIPLRMLNQEISSSSYSSPSSSSSNQVEISSSRISPSARSAISSQVNINKNLSSVISDFKSSSNIDSMIVDSASNALAALDFSKMSPKSQFAPPPGLTNVGQESSFGQVPNFQESRVGFMPTPQVSSYPTAFQDSSSFVRDANQTQLGNIYTPTNTSFQYQCYPTMGQFQMVPLIPLRTYGNNEKLKGKQNFKMWERDIKNDLAAANAIEWIACPRAEHLSLPENIRRGVDAQVQNLIRMNVAQPIKTLIFHLESACEIYQELKRQYGSKTIHDMIAVMNRLDELKYVDNSELILFLSKFDAARRSLVEFGQVFPPSFWLIKLIQKLNPSFEAVIDTLCARAGEDLSEEMLRTSLLDYVERNKSTTAKPTESAPKRQEYARKAASTPSTPQSGKSPAPTSSFSSSNIKPIDESSNKSSIKIPTTVPAKQNQDIKKEIQEKKVRCKDCGWNGHTADKCFNGNKKVCYRCQKPGHEARNCPAPQPDPNSISSKKRSG